MAKTSNIVVAIRSLPPPIPTAIKALENHHAEMESIHALLTNVSKDLDRKSRKPIKRAIKDLTRKIAHLKAQIDAAKAAERAANPEPTAEELAAIEADLDERARLAPRSSNSIEGVCELNYRWAMKLLKKQRDFIDENGCWLTRNVSGHKNGYQKFNFRNTTNPATGLKIGVSIWGHQFAVVAKREGPWLRLTRRGVRNVSHLCHNPGCFNPEHVVVELHQENRARNDCKRSNRDRNGNQAHPCPHKHMGRRKSCLLRSSQPKTFDPSEYIDLTQSDSDEEDET